MLQFGSLGGSMKILFCVHHFFTSQAKCYEEEPVTKNNCIPLACFFWCHCLFSFC